MFDFPSSGLTVGQVVNGPNNTQYKWDGTKWVASTQFGAPSYNDVGRNLIHNAQFNISQRGAGPWSAAGYTVDRWVIGLSGADTVNLYWLAASDAERTAVGDESMLNKLQVGITGSASGYTFLFQKIEKAQRLSGKTVTVSFWAATNTAGNKIGVNYEQEFGTGGSPSSPVAGAAGYAVTLSTTWARYSVTIALPSTIGETFGTNGDDCTRLELWLSAGTAIAARAGIGQQSGIIYLWGVQLEIGNVATPLAKRDPADDLALCQRFYQVGSYGFQGYGGAGYNNQVTVTFPVTMRAVPTIVNNVTSNSNVTLGSSSLLSHTYAVDVTALSTALGPFYYIGTFTASADL